MSALKLILKTDDPGLQSLRSNVKFLDKKVVGCGEEFPIEAPRKNNYRSKINRRVELLFFEPGQEPELDCHPGGACQPILCDVYNPKMYVYTPVPVAPARWRKREGVRSSTRRRSTLRAPGRGSPRTSSRPDRRRLHHPPQPEDGAP